MSGHQLHAGAMGGYRRSLMGLAVLAAGLTACSSGVEGTATAPDANSVSGVPSRTGITMPSASPRSTVPRTSPPVTTPPIKTTVPVATAEQYLGDRPGFYYFATPSGKFECGVFVTDTSVAGCHGTFPRGVPKVEGSASPNSVVAPNTIQLTAGSKARFLSAGDPRFHRFDAPARGLAYGVVLSIPGSGSSNGLKCLVDEKSGVSCSDQVGHGFTVSDTAFDLH